MEIKANKLLGNNHTQVKSVDKLMILLYNIILLAGASYLVVEHDVTAWIYLIALFFGATWNEKDTA